MSFTKTQLTKAVNNNLRKAILTALSVSATLGYSGQAAAISPADLGSIASGATVTVTGTAPKRAWSDYGTNENYGWTHTAAFRIFEIGNAADLLAGTRFDVTVDLKQNIDPTKPPMNYPGFSIWTSGTTPLVTGAGSGGYGHSWSQVRGPLDGGVAGDPCGKGGDCTLGSNGWLGSGGGGNVIDDHNGWIGYANAGYSFTNKDGDKIQGLLVGASNSSNVGLYGGGAGDPLNGTTLSNVNGSSPYVYGGSAALSVGEAFLTLSGLKAGYYLIGYAGSCPDDNANGQGCAIAGGQAYKLDISNKGVSAVPLPGAVWLFGSAIAGITAFGRRKLASV